MCMGIAKILLAVGSSMLERNPGERDQIFLATKFGITGPGVARSDPKYVKFACNRSLPRLGVDYIDLYYVHRVDKSVPIKKTVAALVDLKKYSFSQLPFLRLL